jgi:hypothetical protein
MRKPFVFATVTVDEVHADFALLPKTRRLGAVAALKTALTATTVGGHRAGEPCLLVFEPARSKYHLFYGEYDAMEVGSIFSFELTSG